MNELAREEAPVMEEATPLTEVVDEEIMPENRRVLSMDDPFQAFKIITHECDLDYIRKLGALLDNITKAMS